MATTRDRIIVATNELFRRRGYNGTSLSHISDAANATVGSIYHFFPGGKEALAVAVVETTGAVYRELFESIVGQAELPGAAYVDFFAAAAAVLEESDFIDPCPIGTIAREVANTSEPVRQAAKTAFDSWITAAREHLIAAGIADDVANELATIFVATVEGMFVLSRTQRATEPLAAAGRHFASLVDHAISARVSPRP
jgi:AcrR family transcriptional regulator